MKSTSSERYIYFLFPHSEYMEQWINNWLENRDRRDTRIRNKEILPNHTMSISQQQYGNKEKKKKRGIRPLLISEN